MKIFLNNKKIPLIPPFLYVTCFISAFKQKAELLNDFFSNQCSLINNNSKIPTNLIHVTDSVYPPLHFQLVMLLQLFKTLIQTIVINPCSYDYVQTKYMDTIISFFGC